MNKRNDEEKLNELLAKAVNDAFDRELEDMPSAEQLAEIYPYSEKSLRKAKEHFIARSGKTSLAAVYLKRASVIALAVLSLSAGALLTGNALRNASSNPNTDTQQPQITESEQIQNSGTETTPTTETEPLVGSTPPSTVHLSNLTIGYVPEGYELADSSENAMERYYLYEYSDGSSFSIYMYVGPGYPTNDGNTYTEHVSINGIQAEIFCVEARNTATLKMANNLCTVVISGLLSEKDELIEIAKNIK